MSTPALIYIVITALTLVLWSMLHNKHVKVNIWTKLGDTACMVGLLYWGGFFS